MSGHAADLANPSHALSSILLARQRARDAFQRVLLALQAAASTPEGVTRAMEEECARVRAEWRKAEADLDAYLARRG